jgi:hypothetical protein
MEHRFATPARSWSRSGSPATHTMLCLCAVLILASIAKASAATALTKTELAVVEGLNSGDGTDLGALPDKTISADFLGRLIAGEIPGTKMRHNGIQLKNARIEGNFDISGEDVRVPFTCEHCVFTDNVDMSDAHFFHNVSFERTTFDHDINMDHAVADGDVDIRDAQFGADVDFSALQVAGSLYVGGAHVNADGQQASFDHVKVGILAEFSNLELKGPLTLESAELNQLRLGRDMNLCNSCTGIRTAPSIDLEQAAIHGELTILGLKVDNLYASGLDVRGRTILQGLQITSGADLRGARFQYLILANDVSWPNQNSTAGSRTQLDGITISQIEVQDARNFDPAAPAYYPATDDLYKTLLKQWPDNAGYSARPYQQLETAFAAAGRSDLADLAYESMKDKERTSGHLSLVQEFGSAMLSLLVRYGREPIRALYASIGFIVLGWFIFRQRKSVDPKKPEDKDKKFNPFWYSLDLFLPLSTLPDADIWAPKQDDRFRNIYARVHSLLGWILIPIGLAAITGLLVVK